MLIIKVEWYGEGIFWCGYGLFIYIDFENFGKIGCFVINDIYGCMINGSKINEVLNV